jgi:photosystem II stability/assembly factor-like uncharacterized protein
MENNMSIGFMRRLRAGVNKLTREVLQDSFRAKMYHLMFALGIFCCISMVIGCDNKRAGHNSDVKPAHVPAITFFDRFYDIAIANKSIWLVGYFGKIAHSPDGGKTWTVQKSGTSNALLGVSFANERLGWAVGDSGTIVHTKDGGVTWTIQQCPANKDFLLKLQFINEKVGVAVGGFGTILHTYDGGTTWVRGTSFKEDAVLNDLFFLNESEGWVAGEFETVLHTRDGGKTWEKQHSGQKGKLFGIAFKDALRGVAVGTSGRILVTTDGGRNWKEATSLTKDTLLKVHFMGNSEVLAIGLRGTLANSSDNGQTWSLLTIPDHYTWLSGIACTKDGIGYLVGDEGKILMSTDGKQWTRIGFGPPQRGPAL